MCNNSEEAYRSIAEILGVINVLQQNANRAETSLDTCDRGFLGCGTNSLNCNTRPVMLYLCCGTPLAMPTTKDNAVHGDSQPVSCVFRVEKMDGASCTFRVLAENNDHSCEFPYVATNSFFTMNLNCVCCLRCLSDTYVECI